MDKSETEWKRMRFKGNKVWQAMEKNGSPVIKNGKVLVKYQLNQDYEYWVHQNAVHPVDESESKQKDRKKHKSPGKSIKKHGKKLNETTETENDSAYNNAICLYTDGASSGNPGPSGIGVLLRYQEHEKEISKYIGMATNNIAELTAIQTGLMELKNTKLPVRIFTDSSYACGVLASGWKARKNLELVKSTKETIAKFKDIKIIKVKGHAGHPENERADFLATSAIKKAGH